MLQQAMTQDLDDTCIGIRTYCVATGAAVVKYGSLLLDAPFHPDGLLAVTMIFGPCMLYSVLLLMSQA